MTRAENWLCLSSYAKDSSDKNTSFKRGPSRFLDFIPPSLIENIKTLDNTLIPSRLKKRIVVEDTEKSPKDATSLPIRPQIVLGIDPGKENVGWSITQRLPDAYTVFRCDTEKPYGQPIERKINELVMRHSPDAIAVEKLEGATDEWFRDVAGCVAQIRSIADQQDIECHFYSPQDVKYAVTGNRNASKEEVELAVKRVCILKEIPKTDHSADAIAASLCYLRNYLNYSRFQNNVRKQEHYNLGSTYLDNKQYSEAIVEFKEAINNASMIDPIYTKAHCGLASAYIGQDKLEEAENSANEALRLDPNYRLAHERLEAIKQAYYNRALNYLDNLQYDEAIIEFNAVLNRDSKFIDAHCGLGRAYLGQGNLREAENSTKEALKLNINYQPALQVLEGIKRKYCELARDYFNQDDLVSAENLANEALRLDPNHQHTRELLEAIKQAYIDKGNDCLRRDELEEAKKVVEEALRLDSNYQPALDLLEKIKQAYYNRSRNHFNKQQYDESIAAFEETINRYPKFTAAHCGLGQAYLGKGNLTAAEKSANEALRLENDYQPALQLLENIKQKYCELARGYLNQDNLAAAENLANEALRLDSNYQLALELLDHIKQTYVDKGNDYFRLNGLEAAEKAAKEALRLDPNCQSARELLEKIKQVYVNKGNDYVKNKAYVKAIKPFQKVVDIDPNNKEAYTNLGFAYYWIDEYDKAANCYRKLTNLDSQDKNAHSNLGNAYYRMDAYADAIKPLQKARDLDPDCEKIPLLPGARLL